MEIKYFLSFRDLNDTNDKIAGLRFDGKVKQKNPDGNFYTTYQTKYISSIEADQYAKSEELKLQFLEIDNKDPEKKDKVTNIANELNKLRMERGVRMNPNLAQELYKIKNEMQNGLEL